MDVERQKFWKLVGIYAIKHKTENKVYIGSANNLYRRAMGHRRLLRKNIHHSIHLQRAWNKYGEDSFIFEVIEVVNDVSKLIEREQYWMNYYKAYDDQYGYNISSVAGSTLGVKPSEETRKKLSKVHKGKPFTEEHKRNLGLSLKGQKRSNEICKAMSEARKGKGVGKDNPFFGKTHSPETVAKIVKAHLGIKQPKHSLRMSGKNNPRFGKTLTEEQRKALAEARARWLKTPDGLAFIERQRQRLLGNKFGEKNKGINRPRSGLDPKP